MLQSISWFQFGSFLLVVGVAYYLYVLVRFYWKDIVSYFLGKNRRSPVRQAPEGTAVLKSPRAAVTIGTEVQPVLSEGKDPLQDQSSELLMAKETVIMALREVVSQGKKVSASKEQLLEKIREVLAEYDQLKKTRYQSTVNDFLFRTCSSEYSLLLREEELEALWD
jgi:hypothetical protein